MANPSQIQRTQAYLRVVIDDGSSHIRVASQHVRVGEDASKVPTDSIQLQEGEDKVRQKFVIDGDKHFCGEIEVANWLQENRSEAHRVIQLSKLALCPEYKDHPATHRFYKAIGVSRELQGQMADVQRFYKWKYKWVLGRIRGWYKNLSPKGINFPGEYWDLLQIEATITVPAIWNQVQGSIICNAARDAGFVNLKLCLEPLCAAAREMRALYQREYLASSVPFLWCDIGHATVDYTLVRIEESHVAGEPPKVVMVGDPSGHLLGAHIVDELAWEHIKECDDVKRHGGLESCLIMLGKMSEEEFIRQAMESVEDGKKKSPCRPFTITINAMDDFDPDTVEGGMTFLNIRITKPQVQRWLDDWKDMLVDTLKTRLQYDIREKVGAVIVTGGGGSNKTVFAGLKLAADEIKIPLISTDDRDNPVAKGGLLLHYTNERDKLRPGCYYAVQAEQFDYRRHPDAITKVKGAQQWNLQADGFNHPELISSLVSPSMTEAGSYEVIERVALMAKVRSDEKFVETHCIPFTWAIEAELNPTLEFEIYFSEKYEPNGKPLLNKEGNMREIFERLQVQDADLTDMDWESHESKIKFFVHDNKKWFYINGFIQIIATSFDWSLQVTILEPGEDFRYTYSPGAPEGEGSPPPSKRQRTTTQKNAVERQLDSNFEYRVMFKSTRPIWNEYCSHTISGARETATSSMPAKPIKPTKPRNIRYTGVPRTMGTRLYNAPTEDVIVCGSAAVSDKDTRSARDTIGTPGKDGTSAMGISVNDVALTIKRAPSGRKGVKSENTARARMLHPQFANRLNDSRTPLFSVQKARQHEQAGSNVGPTGALSRLRALHERPPGTSAEDIFGPAGI